MQEGPPAAGISQGADADRDAKFLVHHCLVSNIHTNCNELVQSYTETSDKRLPSVGISAALKRLHPLSEIPGDSFKIEKKGTCKCFISMTNFTSNQANCFLTIFYHNSERMMFIGHVLNPGNKCLDVCRPPVLGHTQ